jgi:5-methylcytosine-specific restriction endonuclease McrA
MIRYVFKGGKDMDFKNKTDSDLISEFKDLVAKERQLQTRILQYLRIIENKKIYLALGFSSLFVFLTEEIGYSETTAYRRIQAMRLIQEMPEVEQKLETGKISLSVASQFHGFLKKENQKRKLNQRPKLSLQEKSDLLSKIEGTSAKKCEQKLIGLNPELALPQEKTKTLTPDKTLIQFLANKELIKKIERLKSLTSHQNPEGKYEVLMEKLVEIALEKLDPIRRELRRSKSGKKETQAIKNAPSAGPVRNKQANSVQWTEANCALASPERARIIWGEHLTNADSKIPLQNPQLSTLKVGRYISPKLKDQIWVRDQGRCQFQESKTGGTCGSQYQVELDHRFPFSLGGENFEKNLQLRCRAHNQYQAKLIFD